MVIKRAAGLQPLAALLFGRDHRPTVGALADVAAGPDGFGLLNAGFAPQGTAELLRDGLTFDLTGLAPAHSLEVPETAHRVALPSGFDASGLEAMWFTVGPHLAGAENLLPVLRVAAAVLKQLTLMDGIEAIVWRPARLVMSPAWFAEAIGVWLAGGPFPALALTALVRSEDCIGSEGLDFLIGQEFLLRPRTGSPSREDSRIAVRLTDWLVAHGRVDSGREVVLSGVGAVWLEPDGQNRLNAVTR